LLEELPSGKEAKILSEHPFLYLLAHEPAYLGGRTNFYNTIEPANNSDSVDAIELFLRGILRSAAGSRSVEDLNTVFRKSMDALVEEMMEDLPDGADQRIVDQLVEARVRLGSGLTPDR
jgi:hypothetical protein